METNTGANVAQISQTAKELRFHLNDLALFEQNMTVNGIREVTFSPAQITAKNDRVNILIDANGLHCDAQFWKDSECTILGDMQQVYMNEPIVNIADALTKLDAAGVIDADFDLEGE